MRPVLLVGNPTAQSGRNAARIAQATRLFAEHALAAELFPTQPDGITIEVLAQRLELGNDSLVVAMGGDGTFREVAAAILQSGKAEEVTLGMLPTGTANDQGKSFGLSATEAALARNVAIIANGHETRLDAGRLDALHDDGEVQKSALFFDSVGFGLSARVLSRRNLDRTVVDGLGPLRELYRDHAVYAGALVRTLLEAQIIDDKFSAAIEADEQSLSFHGLTDLVIKGTRIYGGAWVFDPTSRHDDGAFELVVFRSKREWLSKAIVDLDGNPVGEAALNEIGIEHSKPVRASRFSISLAQEGTVPIAAQIDGEELPCTYNVAVEVLPRAIRLIVPAP